VGDGQHRLVGVTRRDLVDRPAHSAYEVVPALAPWRPWSVGVGVRFRVPVAGGELGPGQSVPLAGMGFAQVRVESNLPTGREHGRGQQVCDLTRPPYGKLDLIAGDNGGWPATT
jgi:hypothetical protein